ncbi:MAG: LytTR family DNA-binding domain-containing protein, partial [Bacteroidota bacterium]
IFGNALLNTFLFLLPALLVGLLKGSDSQKDKLSKVLIQDGHQQVYVPNHEVYFLESSGNYVTYHTASKKYVVRKSLTQAEKDLPNNFLRCHKSFVVNCELISRKSYGEISVGEHSIPVGRKYQEKLKTKLPSTN